MQNAPLFVGHLCVAPGPTLAVSGCPTSGYCSARLWLYFSVQLAGPKTQLSLPLLVVVRILVHVQAPLDSSGPVLPPLVRDVVGLVAAVDHVSLQYPCAFSQPRASSWITSEVPIPVMGKESSWRPVAVVPVPQFPVYRLHWTSHPHLHQFAVPRTPYLLCPIAEQSH